MLIQCFPQDKKKGGGIGQLLSYWSVYCTFIEDILSFDVYTWKEGGAPGKKRGAAPPSFWGKHCNTSIAVSASFSHKVSTRKPCM